MLEQKQLVNIVIDSLEQKKRIVLKTRSGSLSMRPLILDDTLLVIESISDIKDIKTGDLVLMNFYTEFCCHRVIERTPKGIYTKGDNNPVIDFPIKNEQILGKITVIIRNSKKYNLQTKRSETLGRKIAKYSRKSSMNHFMRHIFNICKLHYIKKLIKSEGE